MSSAYWCAPCRRCRQSPVADQKYLSNSILKSHYIKGWRQGSGHDSLCLSFLIIFILFVRSLQGKPRVFNELGLAFFSIESVRRRIGGGQEAGRSGCAHQSQDQGSGITNFKFSLSFFF